MLHFVCIILYLCVFVCVPIRFNMCVCVYLVTLICFHLILVFAKRILLTLIIFLSISLPPLFSLTHSFIHSIISFLCIAPLFPRTTCFYLIRISVVLFVFAISFFSHSISSFFVALLGMCFSRCHFLRFEIALIIMYGVFSGEAFNAEKIVLFILNTYTSTDERILFHIHESRRVNRNHV